MAADDQQSTTSKSVETRQDAIEQSESRTSPSPTLDKGKGKESLPEQLKPQVDEEQENSEDSSDSASNTSPEADTGASSAQLWQAIFAPQYNAYYFYHTQTGETTWKNPLQPSEPIESDVSSSGPSASSEPDPAKPGDASSSTSQYTALQAAALSQGIDPSLAHLDPSLLTATASATGAPIPTFQAKFNARTGAFTRPDGRTPGHLSEYERMKRMSEFYFDVNAWEEQLAEEKEEEEEGNGKKRKRPTKKDLERFKEQKRAKKIAKTAWLRT